MKLEQVDETYSFRGATKRLVSALRREGFRVEAEGRRYIVSLGMESGEIDISGNLRSRRMIIYDASLNPLLRAFVKKYNPSSK